MRSVAHGVSLDEAGFQSSDVLVAISPTNRSLSNKISGGLLVTTNRHAAALRPL
jgi:hypothetical protein